ncbi:RluA family pseudouridine synthase [Mycoplasma iguanae]|uniref:Pseudouridine synthase n=1 Tax=Mycoplasma iguanae TaxID=292461 RepID=A0ABY5RA44_9MOLU|nr:RluA family pseudouridine synthase [Mycoplasma iguanae]UVD81860.1 RluA family pseudouridine synthase [Mycoplasma iguanae]
MKITAKYSERIDKYISDNSEISRNDIKDLILNHEVFVNGISVRKPKFMLTENDEIEIINIPTKVMDINPEKIPLKIVFEDDDIIIVDKPSGMVVHPAPGNMSGTLVNALLYHFNNNLSDENGYLRPGIVHRIDKNTSGLLIVAKNNKIHKYLTEKLKNHEIKRKYKAIVENFLENDIINLDLPIGRDPQNRQKMAVIKQNSKEARTKVFLEKLFEYENKKYSLIRCELETGRTHQIRVHLSYIKHPVYGDPLYGNTVDDFGQRLHAYELSLTMPDGKELKFTSDLPKEFDIAN